MSSPSSSTSTTSEKTSETESFDDSGGESGQDSSDIKRVAVIGAGASGLVALKSMLEAGMRADCYEKGDKVGGVWQFRETGGVGVPSVMRSTVANTSKEMMAFSDYPPPPDFPEFMPHELVAMYLELYADEYNLAPHVHLEHEVVLLSKSKDHNETGRWLLTVRNQHDVWDELFDAVAICTGLYTYPHIPDMTGIEEFNGPVIHSHDYKDYHGYERKSVLIVGIGNSSADIAVELSQHSQVVYVSVRRKTRVYPRQTGNGIPLDFKNTRWHHHLYKYLPKPVFGVLHGMVVRTSMDASLGVPVDRSSQPPGILNDKLIDCVEQGTVDVKGAILRFTGSGAVFCDDPTEEVQLDVVILGTGYDPVYPFLRPELRFIDGDVIRLYRNVFPLSCHKHPCFAVIGLFRVIGATFPVAEIQARWVASVFSGRTHLPRHYHMERCIAAQHAQASQLRSFVRYQSLVINFLPYIDELASQVGFKPNLVQLALTDPPLFHACYWGPLVAYQYRLHGPNAWKGARQAIVNVNRRFQLMRRISAGSDIQVKHHQTLTYLASSFIIVVATTAVALLALRYHRQSILH